MNIKIWKINNMVSFFKLISIIIVPYQMWVYIYVGVYIHRDSKQWLYAGHRIYQM